jgi:hypothetical protein
VVVVVIDSVWAFCSGIYTRQWFALFYLHIGVVRTWGVLPGHSLALAGTLRLSLLVPSTAACGFVCVLLVLQVALMSAVPGAVAALDRHRGVAGVAQYGLGLLYNQSFAAENRVR